MKVGKLMIVMILAALGFQVNAQRSVFVHESYNSVRKYIHPLQLSDRQVRKWTQLNEETSLYIRDIEYDRRLSARAKARRIDNVLDRQDRILGNILSRRQYNKFRSMRSGQGRNWNSNQNRGRNSRYYDNNRRSNNSGCPANTRSNRSGSYYDGGSYYRG